MDDRWKFLYCDMTELWGHTREALPGKEPGESGAGGREEKPPAEAAAVRRPKQSREVRRPRVKKSRYRSYRTRTADRHRWMRRGS